MVVQLHLQNCKSDKSDGIRVDERLAAGRSAVINIAKFEMSLSGLINGFEKRLSCYRQQDEQQLIGLLQQLCCSNRKNSASQNSAPYFVLIIVKENIKKVTVEKRMPFAFG